MLKNQKGQGLIEYVIIVALMAVATVGVMRVLGNTVMKKYAQITNVLQGTPGRNNVQFEGIREDVIKKRDLGDFFNSGASQD